MVPLAQKKPKRIVHTSARQNRIILRPHNPLNRYKLHSPVPAPGGVGHLRLTLRSQ
jgi:hypothetical protein